MPLNQEQQAVANAILTSNTPITIIQGKAGTGKSYLVKSIIPQLGRVQIICPTNLAKQVYPYASTMHSFFYGEFDDLDEGYQNPSSYNFVRSGQWFLPRINSVDTFVFDEISMVRADTFEMMNKICQVARNSSKPFGGIRVIAVGDMMQLPPIVEEEEVYKYRTVYLCHRNFMFLYKEVKELWFTQDEESGPGYSWWNRYFRIYA